MTARLRPAGRARWALALAALALAALAVVLVGSGADRDALAQEVQGAGARPNVVVVMTDDQRATDMEPMREVRTSIGGQGATFGNFYATFPLCCPSRATFMTGQYAHNHGVFDNEPPFGYQAFPADEPATLAVGMNDAGYRTGYIGKYLNGYGKDGTEQEIPRGWDDWQALTDGGAYNYTLNDNGRLVDYGDRTSDYQTDVFAQRSAGFIRDNVAGAPFFLTVAPQAPHAATEEPVEPAPRHEGDFADEPFPQPPSFNEVKVNDKPSFVRDTPLLSPEQERGMKLKYRARLEALLAVDEAVAKIVRTLKNNGELQNTLVIFTSDNGWMLGEHRLIKKEQMYEESAQVPLLIRGPGIPRGVRRSQITGNIDLAPTILDVANAEHPRAVDGRSLMPLARSAATGSRRTILLENGPNSSESTAVRNATHLYVEHGGADPERELYNLNFDPFQLKSRHVGGPFEQAGSQQVENEMRRELHTLEECSGDSCRGV